MGEGRAGKALIAGRSQVGNERQETAFRRQDRGTARPVPVKRPSVLRGDNGVAVQFWRSRCFGRSERREVRAAGRRAARHDDKPVTDIAGEIAAFEATVDGVNAVSSENAEDATAEAPIVADEPTVPVEAADSEGLTPAPTSEESDEAKSVGAIDAQTPADGTLG